jgi:hypothetical protein
MVWVPTKGRRAGVRARFVELMRDFQGVSVGCFEATESGDAAPKPPKASSTSRPGTASTACRHDAVQKAATAPPKDCSLHPMKAKKKKPRSSKPGERWTIHHIPPRNPTPYILKRVKEHHHQAYHTIFGSAGSLEECIKILKTHWWPPEVRTESRRTSE